MPGAIRLAALLLVLPALAACAPEPTPEPAPAPELRFSAPAGWVDETPSSRMRKAQYVLPSVDDVERDAHLVVFFFGGESGGVEANFERWAEQFVQADGSAALEAAKTSTGDVRGMAVHVMDVSGRYVAEIQPGSGERVDVPGQRMLAAIIESGHGSYFVKLVGPETTVEHWAASFDEYVDSARLE